MKYSMVSVGLEVFNILRTRVRSSNGVTQNYGNYHYGNYIGILHLVGKVITLLKTYELRMHCSRFCQYSKITDNDRLCAYSSPDSHRRKLEITDSDTQIQCQ